MSTVGGVGEPDPFAPIRQRSHFWVRLAATRAEEGWGVHILELVDGAAPPTWELRRWIYDEVHLVAFQATGSQVAEWLSSGPVQIDDQTYAMPNLGGASKHAQRISSGQRLDFEPLGWPTEELSLDMHSTQRRVDGPLIASGVPSFITFQAAMSAHFALRPSPGGGDMSARVAFRQADRRARIAAPVRIADDYVEVDVEGDALAGLEVELAGDMPGQSQSLAAADTTTVRFALEGGLPSGAWVVIKSGSTWIDRRFLTSPYSRATEAHLEWVVEPMTKLQAFLATRERHQVEFKSVVPSGDAEKLHMMKTVAAFANREGGSILIGVTDDRELKGIPETRIDRAQNAVSQMINSWVRPPAPHSFNILPIDDSDKVVLELVVLEGTHIYGAGRPAETPIVYVRPYGTTERASPSEIEDIAAKRLGGQHQRGLATLFKG